MGPNSTVWADLYPQLMKSQSELLSPFTFTRVPGDLPSFVI